MSRKKSKSNDDVELNAEVETKNAELNEEKTESEEKNASVTELKNSETPNSIGVNSDMKKTWSISTKSLLVKLQESGKVLGLLVLLAIIVMIFACFAIFTLNVKGPEEVMVPEVRGKELAQALIEMQTKELYPKITLRYSDMPGDEGTILDQDPASGTIVKGYSRVSLVVSRGVVVDHIENYVGMNFDSLKMHLQTLFAGSVRPLIVLANPIYKADISEAGTILEQNPPAGTEISDPVTVKLVVSRGPNFDNTRVPHLVGLSLDEMISLASRSKLIFDFTSHVAAQDELPGTVTGQQDFEREFVPNYSRMSVDMAMPTSKFRGKTYGIFTANLSTYPYPVPMRLEASGENGSVVLIDILHSGGSFTMPYAVESGTTLTLFVVDKATAKITVP